MFIRNIKIFRLICNQNRYRFFSTTNIYLNKKQEENQIHPVNNQLPIVARLPTYLPAPTGVKSKLYDEFYLIYRFGFHRPLRYIQVLKLAQTLAT
jgi:hypothetical protein